MMDHGGVGGQITKSVGLKSAAKSNFSLSEFFGGGDT